MPRLEVKNFFNEKNVKALTLTKQCRKYLDHFSTYMSLPKLARFKIISTEIQEPGARE